MGKSGNVKQKSFMQIHTYSSISRHNQTYSRIILAYSKPCVTLEYGISKPLAYLEPETYSYFWAIQNPVIFRNGGILRTLSNIYDTAL